MAYKITLAKITTHPFLEVCQPLIENVTQIALSATQKVGMTKIGRGKVTDARRQTDGDGIKEATEEKRLERHDQSWERGL